MRKKNGANLCGHGISANGAAGANGAVNGDARFELVLYVTGGTTNCLEAERNLRALCEKELQGQCHLKVVDVLRHPELAKVAKVLATPTLVRLTPSPVTRLVGDLANPAILRDALGVDAPPKHGSGELMGDQVGKEN